MVTTASKGTQSSSSSRRRMKVRLPRLAQTTLKHFQERVLEMFPDSISRIILYGSYAHGTAKPDSDLDVMVVLRREKQPAKTYIGGPGDVRWKQLVNAGIDSMVNNGPFVSVLVLGEDVYGSGLSVARSAQEEGVVLWTARPT